MLALPGPPRGADGEQLLDPTEGLWSDERLVGALVLDTVPLHDADVDRVGEDLGQPLPGDRLGLAVTASPAHKPAVGQLLRQALERPFAGGVGLEGSGDERGALWIGDDARHLVAGDHLAQVHIAERGAVGEAALLRLLAEPIFDLGGEVGRVELGHERVDALDQASRGGLLNVLGHRHERHATAAKQRPDGDVVLHVACQAVDLVDDDGVDVARFCDAREHGLQGRSVS